MSAPASVVAVSALGELRRRALVLLVALALALGAFLVPQAQQAAHAATFWVPQTEQTTHATTSPHITSSNALSFARTMLGLLNKERRAHGRRPLTMASKLRLSAHRHNLRMARDNEMSHQLPGEAFFATRITNAGYHWRAAGENIGWNSELTLRGLLNLEREMYHEVPPNDGHRVNILSRTFRQVGIDVYYDKAHHKIWFTQDFGAPAR
jgi:uncharacterized protein YkwD